MSFDKHNCLFLGTLYIKNPLWYPNYLYKLTMQSTCLLANVIWGETISIEICRWCNIVSWSSMTCDCRFSSNKSIGDQLPSYHLCFSHAASDVDCGDPSNASSEVIVQYNSTRVNSVIFYWCQQTGLPHLAWVLCVWRVGGGVQTPPRCFAGWWQQQCQQC